MNEVLSCIKLIKMYAWEKSFAKVIGGNKNEVIKQSQNYSESYCIG